MMTFEEYLNEIAAAPKPEDKPAKPMTFGHALKTGHGTKVSGLKMATPDCPECDGPKDTHYVGCSKHAEWVRNRHKK